MLAVQRLSNCLRGMGSDQPADDRPARLSARSGPIVGDDDAVGQRGLGHSLCGGKTAYRDIRNWTSCSISEIAIGARLASDNF
jgi:hypothetical protein